MDGQEERRIRIFGPAPIRKTLEIKSSGSDCLGSGCGNRDVSSVNTARW